MSNGEDPHRTRMNEERERLRQQEQGVYEGYRRELSKPYPKPYIPPVPQPPQLPPVLPPPIVFPPYVETKTGGDDGKPLEDYEDSWTEGVSTLLAWVAAVSAGVVTGTAINGETNNLLAAWGGGFAIWSFVLWVFHTDVVRKILHKLLRVGLWAGVIGVIGYLIFNYAGN